MNFQGVITFTSVQDQDLIAAIKTQEHTINPNMKLNEPNTILPIGNITIVVDKTTIVQVNGGTITIDKEIELFTPLNSIIVKTAGSAITCYYSYGDIVLGRQKSARRQVLKVSANIESIITNVQMPENPTEEDLLGLQNQVFEQINRIKLSVLSMQQNHRLRDSKRTFNILGAKLVKMQEKLVAAGATIPEITIEENNPMSIVQGITTVVKQASVVSGPPLVIAIWNE